VAPPLKVTVPVALSIASVSVAVSVAVAVAVAEAVGIGGLGVMVGSGGGGVRGATKGGEEVLTAMVELISFLLTAFEGQFFALGFGQEDWLLGGGGAGDGGNVFD
jgi:hypothetical protein